MTKRVGKLVRIAIPSALIMVWLAISGIGGPYFGKISEVSSNDQSTFLPASAESTRVNDEIKKFKNEQSIPAIIVFSDNKSLPADTISKIKETTTKLNNLPGVAGRVSPPIASSDGQAALVVVNMASDTDYKKFTPQVREILNKADLPVEFKITGPVGFLNDLANAFSGIDGLLLIVALAVVFVILLLVYRSPFLPFIVLLNSMVALCAAILTVFYLAKSGTITINGQVQGILFILVIGAATDYALLFVARYREELTKHKEVTQAILTSWKRSVEPIAAAGGTVIAGLLCLLLSDLNSNKALGPVGAIGIAMAIIATLTFLPSMLLILGRKLFWPRTPQYKVADGHDIQNKGIWPKVSNLISNHARAVWIVVILALASMTLGMSQLKAHGVDQSDFILGQSEARDGQKLLGKHFPGGSGTPTQVIVSAQKLSKATDALQSYKGVATVMSTTNGRPFTNAPPKVVDGKVLIEVTLKDDAYSDEALGSIADIRQKMHAIDSSSLVGGTAAIQLDTLKSAEHDRAVVIPAVLIVITIILMVLLRSILAPILLLLTTVLSFTAILGLSALVFNHILGFPGADPSVVLYGFIFLVALGIDYNIFLMTRVREESLRHGTRKGTLVALVATGSVITSAGIVLAATFAALAVIPILFLAQLAFIVSLGVLIDTVVVRSLLVPALTHQIGKTVWWPSRQHKD